MKKIFSIFILATLLLSVFVFAQQEESGQGSGQGQEVDQETQNQGEEQQLVIAQQEQVKTKEEVKQVIQERKQEMEQELETMDEKEQKVYSNQNTVREAVHAFLAMEDLVGGIGPQVSEIARAFNNSVKTTVEAEEKVINRGWFTRLLAGGDEKAAKALAAQVAENRNRIEQLTRLREQCTCDEEVKTMMQEQIQNMEQETTRLQELAQKEEKSKGLFGWLWK